jgi:hypothetical protein
MTESYFVLGGLLVSICLLMSWMFIWSHVHYLIKVGAGSAVVAASIYVWILLTAVMGYPVHQFPLEGSTILAFALDKPDKAIYLWIYGSPQPRAFQIPYTDKTAENMMEAQRKAQQTNGRMVFHSGKKGEAGEGDADGDADGTGRNGKGHGKKGSRQGGFGFFDDNSEIPVTVEVKPNLPPKE